MSDETDHCDVLFVGSRATADGLESALEATVDYPLVTVVDDADAWVSATGDDADTAATIGDVPVLAEPPDCVVVETSAVGPSIADVIAASRERYPDCPVVIVSDDGDGAEAGVGAVIDANLVSAVTAVVRPGADLDGRLAERVREIAIDHRTSTRQREHERYRALIEQTPNPVVLLDDGGVITFANDAAATYLGVDSSDALIGRPFETFVADRDRAATKQRLDAVANGRRIENSQTELRDADGNSKWATLAAQPLEVDDEAELQVTLADITEHKQLGARLRTQLDRFSALFENLNEPVVEVHFEDDQPIVEAVNPAFTEMFDVTEDDAIGATVDEIIVPVDDHESAHDFNRRAKAGERLEVEARRETRDGQRDFLLRYVPFDDDADRGYAIYIDVTERREWERQLRRQNERLEEVARVVSHDLRNPLNVASGTIEALVQDADPEERALFERIERSHDRMEAIIDDMLTLARQGKSVSDVEPVDLAVLARDVWATIEAPDASLVAETGTRILADRSRLQSVFGNLFENAVKYGGDDVTVTVGDIDRSDGATADASGAETPPPSGAPVGFYVADNGPGIPEDDRDKVFESGYTTGENSTGFGLAIVQSVIEAHGWTIRVTESEDGGARFEITGVEHVDE